MAGQLRAIVYSRVSTDAQERDGTSLVTQERASQEYVDADGWILLENSSNSLLEISQLLAEKIANRWLISRRELEEFAKTYKPQRGRPRTKRKYTKRSPKWQAN